MNDTTETEPKPRRGGFKKGKSGNPAGRPKGAKNAVTILKEAVLQGAEDVFLANIEKITTVVCKKAVEGDLTAAKMVLDRVVPVKKAVEFGTKDGKDLGINIIVKALEETVKRSELLEGDIVDAEIIEED
jgi:hypothetical protein